MPKRRRDRWDGTERRAPAMVLIAGDDANANELLSRVLEARGYRTVTATTADTATRRATEQLPRAAVVDLGGGISASLKLLDFFRGHESPKLHRCRVVMIARSAANREYCFRSGADDFLERPFHVNDLVASIEAALATPFDELPVRRRQLLDGAEDTDPATG